MSRRESRHARFLGVWTAVWLGGLLLGGLLWLGDLSLQWPVLLVPVLWGLVAMRRRGEPEPVDVRADRRYRTDTVERPVVRPPRRDGWS